MTNSSNNNPFGLLYGLGSLNTATPKTSLADLLLKSPPPAPQYSLADLARALAPPPPPTNALMGLFAPLPTGFGSLAPLPPPLSAPPARPATQPAPVKRKAFFSFHYSDSLRVNNVRNAWRIKHPDATAMQSFYDSSLWEKRKLTDPEAIKNLIRSGVKYTSAVCVLVGTDTWWRRWVRYEVARSVIDGRGLLAVHINGLNHHERRRADPLGLNPLDFMGVFKAAAGGFYLYEKLAVTNPQTGVAEWQWHPYQDYTSSVPLPRYLAEPSSGHVMPLSWHTDEYDFVAGVGHKNIGAWIDRAAQRVGR